MKKSKSIRKYNSEVKFGNIIASLDFNNNNQQPEFSSKATVRTTKNEGANDLIKVEFKD